MANEQAERFIERVARGPILGDGAMGTQLFERGELGYDRCLDELNLSNPELVKSIHLDYISAGAEIIETNTFGANRMRLAAHKLEGQVQKINEAAVRIAQEARRLTGQQIWVCGAIGPLGRPLSSLGPNPDQKAREIFRQQIQALSQMDVDLLVIETFGDLQELRQAVLAAKEVCDLPIIAQATFTEEGKTLSGDTPLEIVRSVEEMGVAVIGANCSVGSEGMLGVVQEMAPVAKLPLSAQPNAGFPMYQGNRVFYRSSPEYMARHARQLMDAGVVMLGGCCGTTPEHIAAIRDTLLVTQAPRAKKFASSGMRPHRTAPSRIRAPESTGLSRKIGKKFVVTVEVDPPKGFDVSATLEALLGLKSSGMVDAFNVADNPRAQSRMSALAMSALIQSRLGMESILHLTLRHRNMVALQSELLGAHALGVRNLLVVMGDPPNTGDYPRATAVSDIVPSSMIKLIKAFNRGTDINGKPLEYASSFLVACAFNPGADNLDREIRVLNRKLEAGADFILTQPVYTPEVVEEAKRRLGGFPVPLLLGVLPLRSYRHAEFLHNEVPGITIPKEVLERLRDAGEQAGEVGMQLCLDLLKEVGHQVAGIYVIPPAGRYDMVLKMLERLTEKFPGLTEGVV